MLGHIDPTKCDMRSQSANALQKEIASSMTLPQISHPSQTTSQRSEEAEASELNHQVGE